MLLAFELWCWGRLLRVPWTARGSNHSILKEVSPEYSLEGLILKLKLHLMRRTDSLEKTLMLGKIEGMRRRGRQPMDCSLSGSSSVGFSRQECCSGLPFPSPGDLPDPGIKPGSPALHTDSFPTELSGKPCIMS